MTHPQKATLRFTVVGHESHRERTQHAASSVTLPKQSQDTDPHTDHRDHVHVCLRCTLSITNCIITATKPKPAQTQSTDDSFMPSRIENICNRGLQQSLENENVMEDFFNKK